MRESFLDAYAAIRHTKDKGGNLMLAWQEARYNDLEAENDRLTGLLEESHALLADYADIVTAQKDMPSEYVFVIKSLINKIAEYVEIQ